MESKQGTQEINMNLHDLNKTVIAAMTELPKDIIDKKMEEVLDWLRGDSNTYYMLLSNERRDFTIFKTKIKNNDVIKELLEVLSNRGKIKAIDKVEGAFEIWVDDAFYALFPYDAGVIEI